MRASFLVALAAGCLAVGSASGAVASGAVTGAQVQNSSLTGKDVKDHSIVATDFKPGTKGPGGPSGATGAAATNPGYHVTFDPTQSSASVAPHSQQSYVISCPAGATALGAGASETGNYVTDSAAVDGHPEQWRLTFVNNTDQPLTPALYLYCTT